MRLTRAEAKEQNRRALLEAAREIVVRDGYRARLDEIAERAGLTTGAVYSLYGSKNGLFAALLRDHLAPFYAAMAPLADPGLSLLEVVDGYARRYCAVLLDDRLGAVMALETALTDLALRDPALLEQVDLAPDHLTGLLAGRPYEGVPVSEAEARRLATAVKGVLSGIAQQAVFETGDLSGLCVDAARALVVPAVFRTEKG